MILLSFLIVGEMACLIFFVGILIDSVRDAQQSNDDLLRDIRERLSR